MRIKAAADALDVPIPTVRRWTQEFAAGLSPEARASEGRPREFGVRDMRVLRRAKELLTSRKDFTYERVRRELAAEGLLQYEAEPGNDDRAPRDEAADREAAERFVRDVVERATAPLREVQTQLLARIAELEREVRALRDVGAAPARSAVGLEADARRGSYEEPDRRRTWPFRTG